MTPKPDLVPAMEGKYPKTLLEAICFLDFFLRQGYRVSNMRIGCESVVVFRLYVGEKVHEEHIGTSERPGNEMFELWKDLCVLWMDHRQISFEVKAKFYRGSIVSTRESGILAQLSALQMDKPLVDRWRKVIRKSSGAFGLATH